MVPVLQPSLSTSMLKGSNFSRNHFRMKMSWTHHCAPSNLSEVLKGSKVRFADDMAIIAETHEALHG